MEASSPFAPHEAHRTAWQLMDRVAAKDSGPLAGHALTFLEPQHLPSQVALSEALGRGHL